VVKNSDSAPAFSVPALPDFHIRSFVFPISTVTTHSSLFAPMLFQLTAREKRALGIIALLIALGFTGLWLL
jgi:hypothetical protein